MVRVNLIDPACLADQHLIAEYNEILMLLGYVKKHPAVRPGEIPSRYTLGKGHIKFFKDKLLYLKRRHGLLKGEMRRRGFVPTKNVRISDFPRPLANDWSPGKRDFDLIKVRLVDKIRKKPGFYRYNRSVLGEEELVRLVAKG